LFAGVIRPLTLVPVGVDDCVDVTVILLVAVGVALIEDVDVTVDVAVLD